MQLDNLFKQYERFIECPSPRPINIPVYSPTNDFNTFTDSSTLVSGTMYPGGNNWDKGYTLEEQGQTQDSNFHHNFVPVPSDTTYKMSENTFIQNSSYEVNNVKIGILGVSQNQPECEIQWLTFNSSALKEPNT